MDVRWTRRKPCSQMLVNSFTSSSLVKVSVSDIKNLMNNKITMKSIFEERDDCYWVSYQDDIFTSTKIESELQSQFLPEDGCYLGRLTDGCRKVGIEYDSWKDQMGELQSAVLYELVPDDFISYIE